MRHALAVALTTRRSAPGALHHTDHAAGDYRARLAAHAMERSMSGVGD